MNALPHAFSASGFAGPAAGSVHRMPRPDFLGRAREWLYRRLWHPILVRRRSAATCLVLEDLDDRTLKDIGLYRPDVGAVVTRLYELDRAWSVPRAPLRRGC